MPMNVHCLIRVYTREYIYDSCRRTRIELGMTEQDSSTAARCMRLQGTAEVYTTYVQGSKYRIRQ